MPNNVNTEEKKAVSRGGAKNAGMRDYTKVILNDNTDFSIVEAYKSTRTNLEYALAAEEGCKKIIFTSAMPSEGKTTSCINTAITFALAGAKIVLIDADLRKPKVHMCLELENATGFSNYLAGFAELDDVIQHCKNGLDVITSGQIPPNPSELLVSPRMEKALLKLSEKYDYVIIDAPPVNIVSDAVSMSKFVTGVAVVVKEDFTTHDALKKALSNLEFANAKILGFILNDVMAPRGYYSKYYKYRYHYKYNYRYKYSNYDGYDTAGQTKKDEKKDK
mgnify:FL=1